LRVTLKQEASVIEILALAEPTTSGGVLMDYLPVLIMAAAVVGFAVLNVGLSWLFGQRRPTKEKLMPYECGKDPVGSARERHSVRFYLVAMIFLLFDIEAIFLIPWAVAYGIELNVPNNKNMQILLYGEMMAFIAVLFVGLIYVWKKGLFEWNR
jgi:NADH-quinone oxidoreductase subunit A